MNILIVDLHRKPRFCAPEALECVYRPPYTDSMLSCDGVQILCLWDIVVQAYTEPKTQCTPYIDVRRVEAIQKLTEIGLEIDQYW